MSYTRSGSFNGMTTNKLMLLLQIYRGTVRDEAKMGTYAEDLKYLQRKDLIVPHKDVDNDWVPTPIGDAMVRLLLTTAADLLALTSSPLNQLNQLNQLKGDKDG